MIKIRLYNCIIFRRLTTYQPSRSMEMIPKSRTLATELYKKRVDSKQNSKSINLNHAEFTVIGSYSQGFRPSLLVSSEGNGYLFNCCEGTQRFCYSSKVKLKTVERVFVTRSSWDHVSGAIGLSLTMQDIGMTNFMIYGPENISKILDSTRSFILYNTGIQCSTKSPRDGDYKDQHISIAPIIIDNVATTDTDGSENDYKKLKKIPKLLSYSCALPDLPGRLLPKKCKELKVPVGPLLGRLKSGCDVTLADGSVVRSEDVCEPKNFGLRFIVVECPSIKDIDLITNNLTLNQHRQMRKNTDGTEIGIVVHFSPGEVTSHPKYRNWMESFPEECKHLLLLPDTPKRVNFIDTYRLNYLLRQLDEVTHPPLFMPDSLTNIIDKELLESADTRNSLEFGNNDPDEREIKMVNKDNIDRVTNVSSLDKFIVRPNETYQSVGSPMHIDAMYRAAKADLQFEQYFNKLKKMQENMPTPKNYEPELIFLGTGSAMPSKYRNTSGILVNFQQPHESSIILDCGEDTYGQLIRFYGPDKAEWFLKRLKMIYISHHHADHHIGLIRLLMQRKLVCRDKLILLLPPGLEHFLYYYNDNFEDLSDTYEIYGTKSLKTNPSFENRPAYYLKKDLCRKLDGLLEDFTIIGVDHCVNACAISMKFNIGSRGDTHRSFTLAYSGDARPSKDFILTANKCDLLIHEATFDNRDEDEAKSKGHCTSTEAIKVAKKMQAKFTILTHFSQRLPKIPYITDDFDDSIGFAFDNMAIRCPTHFQRLPVMNEILKLVFIKELCGIDERHAKQDAKKVIARNILDARRASHSDDYSND